MKSGAQCITTSSYQASIPGLIAAGYDRDSAENLLRKSVQLAEKAIQTALESGILNDKPLIAASIGPYGAFLADGSEYHGNYGVSDETLRDFHLERIQILDDSKADLMACETIPSLQEAKVLSDILLHVDKPAWMSFSCKDEQHLNDGSKITEGASILKDHPNVFAVGINCTSPNHISSLIKSIKPIVGNRKIIVYPNSGEVYNAKKQNLAWLVRSEKLC